MTERPAAYRARRAPSPATGCDAPQPAHRLRRIGAAALAVGMFLGLGAALGPVGVANAAGSCSDAKSYFTAGEHTVSAEVVGSGCEISVSGAVILILNANLTITGDGGESGFTIDGDGSLTVQGTGTLTVIGGAGSAGSNGDPGSDSTGPTNATPGDDAYSAGSNGSAGIYVAARGILDVEATVDVTGGAGGAGGNGGDGGNAAADSARSGADGGDGKDGGVGGVGIHNEGTVIVGGTLTANGGKGGDGGAGGSAGTGDGNEGQDGQPGEGGNGGAGGIRIDNQAAFITARGGNWSGYSGAGGAGGASDGTNGSDGQPGGQGTAGFATSAYYDANLPDGCTAKGYYNIAWPSLDGRTVDDGLAFLPATWPSCTGFERTGWASGKDPKATGYHTFTGTETLTNGLSIFAVWAEAEPDDNSGTDNSGTDNSGDDNSGSDSNSDTTPTTTTSAPVTTTKPTPATTTTKPTPTTGTSPTSIPTNNLASPETFVSAHAPAPQPLPGMSQANDSSASRFDVNTHKPTQGGDLTLTARGFKPGTVVDFWMHSTPTYLGSAIADIHGIAVLPVKLTPDLVGDHHVQSIGTGLLGEPRNLAQPITIVAPAALASTGVASAPLVFLAVLLLAGGAALMLADRRRARHAAPNTAHR